MSRSLRANLLWTFVGNVVHGGCQWGMLVILARLGSADLLGQFALGLAATGPIVAFSLLGLRAIQATDARRSVRFGDYFALRLMTTAAALATIAGIALASQSRLEAVLVILATGVAAVPEAISDVVYGFLQNRERMDRIAVSVIARDLLGLATLAVCVWLSRDLVWSVLALGTVRGLVLVGYDLPSARRILGTSSRAVGVEQEAETVGPRWHPAALLHLVRLGWPLGVGVMLTALVVNVPRYFVEHWCGTAQLGIFAATAYLMFPGTTVIDALGQAASPRLARCYQDGRIREFGRLLSQFLAVGAFLGLVVVVLAFLAGPPLLEWFYGPAFRAGGGVLVWLMVAAGLNYMASFLGYAVTAARYFKTQVFVHAMTVTVSLLMCAWLVPRHGLVGAAWAMVIAALAQLFNLGLIAVHALRQEPGSPVRVVS